MKQLTCEMCGSTDLVKQDGVFVCQTCGCKYSIEEAKKMMVEGTVDVSGSTVKVDTSGELANLYQIARRAKDDHNSENAEKYYDMILVKDPTSWEASFYVVYFKAQQCKIAQISSACKSVENCIGSVLQLIKDNVSDRNEQVHAVMEVAAHCTVISDMLFRAAVNHFCGIDLQIRRNYVNEVFTNCFGARNIVFELGNKVDSLFNDYEELHFIAVEAWKNAIVKYLSCGVPEEDITKDIEKIRKYDSSYQTPRNIPNVFDPRNNPNDVKRESENGCYVATAVYGSYDCPQVWTLRRYRDYTLAETWYGRAFIHTYYAISPTLVKWFGHTEWFKKMWKGKLDRMVEKLQDSGVESTPYQDRKW